MKSMKWIVTTLVSLSFTGVVFAEKTADLPKFAQDKIPLSANEFFTIHPFEHASLVIAYKNKGIYIDPVGPGEDFKNVPAPALILITDTHSDHFDLDALEELATADTTLMLPEAVRELLPKTQKGKIEVIKNGEEKSWQELKIEAVAMYNLDPGRPYHTKGRGNGYVLTIGGKRVYIAGDTEDIPEMRALKDIEVAFLPMNLPYTMNVEQAASAAKAFSPKIVYPYHYQVLGDTSDIAQFAKLLEGTATEVRLRNWYPY